MRSSPPPLFFWPRGGTCDRAVGSTPPPPALLLNGRRSPPDPGSRRQPGRPPLARPCLATRSPRPLPGGYLLRGGASSRPPPRPPCPLRTRLPTLVRGLQPPDPGTPPPPQLTGNAAATRLCAALALPGSKTPLTLTPMPYPRRCPPHDPLTDYPSPVTIRGPATGCRHLSDHRSAGWSPCHRSSHRTGPPLPLTA